MGITTIGNVRIGGRSVGQGEPPYVIAEIGSNHNGDIELCERLIDTAHSCGAHAVKFQSWSTSSLISRAEYARNTTYTDKKRHFGSLKEMVEKYQLTEAQHRRAAAHCARAGITFLSSCFSPREVDLLVELGVDCLKIASMDVNHLPLLDYVGRTGRSVILSTGMATLAEIERAVAVLRDAGSGPVALLHCVSIYPPEYSSINLRNIQMLQKAFDVPVGFSDHSIGPSASLAAVALGASIIEKHFTLDRDLPGWDHWLSADPSELSTLCREARNVFEALGSAVRVVGPAEMAKRKVFRRRIVLTREVKRGEQITTADLDFKRPGNGIHPDEMERVVGRRVVRDLQPDDELEWNDLN